MNGIPDVDIRRETSFSGNKALSGAGFLMIARSNIKNQASIAQTTFTENVADANACQNRSVQWGNACMNVGIQPIFDGRSHRLQLLNI